MQATFRPGAAELALWGTADPGKAARDLGLPDGYEDELTTVLPADGTIAAAEVPAVVVPVADALAP
ncbi:hypothetical protein, partial [Saccharopolyspora kobensis]